MFGNWTILKIRFYRTVVKNHSHRMPWISFLVFEVEKYFHLYDCIISFFIHSLALRKSNDSFREIVGFSRLFIHPSFWGTSTFLLPVGKNGKTVWNERIVYWSWIFFFLKIFFWNVMHLYDYVDSCGWVYTFLAYLFNLFWHSVPFFSKLSRLAIIHLISSHHRCEIEVFNFMILNCNEIFSVSFMSSILQFSSSIFDLNI